MCICVVEKREEVKGLPEYCGKGTIRQGVHKRLIYNLLTI